MKEIAKTGYWNGETAHLHHVHSQELSDWICEFLKSKNQKHNPIIDLGCGKGQYLKDLKDKGFTDLIGYEGDPPKKRVFDFILKQDLTIPFFNLPKNSDVNVISLEVGEHIPAKFMNIYLDNIINNCDNYLITSWAIRGQEGFGHVNCLDNEEIIPEIERRGFKLLKQETEEVRNIDLSEAPWFKNTLFIFKRHDIK